MGIGGLEFGSGVTRFPGLVLSALILFRKQFFSKTSFDGGHSTTASYLLPTISFLFVIVFRNNIDFIVKGLNFLIMVWIRLEGWVRDT